MRSLVPQLLHVSALCALLLSLERPPTPTPRLLAFPALLYLGQV